MTTSVTSVNHVCSRTPNTSSVTALAFESDVRSIGVSRKRKAILILFGFALQVAEPHYLRHSCSGAVQSSLKTEQFTQQSFRRHHYIPQKL
jgi:hypothetical protein